MENTGTRKRLTETDGDGKGAGGTGVIGCAAHEALP